MTNQSRPLFAVNEVVIICSPADLEHGTEQTIVDLEWSEDSEWENYQKETWMYRMAGDEEDRYWEESALRKKYPPSSQSFSELMNTLKSSEKV